MRKLKPKGRNDTHEFDYSVISKNIIVGSDFCNGRNCKEHKKEFEKLNVEVEINLAAEEKEMPPDDISSYTWIPVVDGYAPNPAQVDVGVSIIDQAIKNKKTVYIHCKNGHGRSPTLVAAYLIKHSQKSVDESIEFIRKKRPEIHIEKSQHKALLELVTND